MDALGLTPISVTNEELRSLESVTLKFIKLINASWNLVQKHRMLKRVNDKLNDAHHKTSNYNNNLVVSSRKCVF